MNLMKSLLNLPLAHIGLMFSMLPVICGASASDALVPIIKDITITNTNNLILLDYINYPPDVLMI